MRRITYQRATAVADAVACKARHGPGGRFLAGGTDLLVALRGERPDLPPLPVIDLTPIAELRGIALIEDAAPEIRVGALTTHTELERATLLQHYAPLLAAAASAVGSPQIRNRGTLGGNICNGSPCADTIPPLLALDAELELHSAAGARRLALADALRGPYDTTLAADEMLVAVRFRALPPEACCGFHKLGRRRAVAISRMSIAVVAHRDEAGRLRDVRLAAGSVAPVPQRFPAVERLLEGEPPEETLYARAGAALAQEMIRQAGRRWSTPYKEPVVAALARRVLRTACDGP